MTGAVTTCTTGPRGRTFIKYGQDPGHREVILIGDPPTTVEGADLGVVDGGTYIYLDMVKKKGESAAVTKDGKRYTVTGAVWGNAPGGGAIKPFVFDAVCP
ncbi:lipoprotein LpqH [Mycobacteroides sp. CBMA 271]|uniref:lipoprotein LpqH n=1 Tax=Mycobacteroides sp. CBMA 271 TaxID=2606608 RepID=UPI0028BDF169|nr:lipoprotein LpqH [Mycobacteroides sp. CBMA 271]